MRFFAPGSSEPLPLPAVAPAISVERTAIVRDKLAALSTDEPLPETYAGDRIRLLAQSPYKLYLYWSHARDPFAALRRAFGEAASARYRVTLRLVDVEAGAETLFEASPARNHWFYVRAGRLYRAEVGLFAQGRPFIRLLTSAEVRSPRASVSALTDDAPQFNVSPPEFARVLNEAGYASDALEVTLEAADAGTHDGSTREIARLLTGLDAPATDPGLLAEMRALLAALAFGVPLDRLREMVSPTLALWLEQVVAAHREPVDGAHLLEILRATLALELEYDDFLSAEDAEATRHGTRFVWGASDVRLPSRWPRVWMPSMTPGAKPEGGRGKGEG